MIKNLMKKNRYAKTRNAIFFVVAKTKNSPKNNDFPRNKNMEFPRSNQNTDILGIARKREKNYFNLFSDTKIRKFIYYNIKLL